MKELEKLGCAISAAWEVSPYGVMILLNATLEELREGQPLPIMTDIQSDAETWSHHATPSELEIFFAEIGKRLSDTPVTAKVRKRMIASLWNDLSPSDQSAFIEWTKKNE